MADGQVVRVLWGDDRPGCRWRKVWRKDVEPALRRAERCPFRVFCYGRKNADELTRRGVPVELVDPEPFPDGATDWDDGSTMVRPWHYKHQLLAVAAREAPTIYCDWDVRILAPEPTPAFELLGDRRRALSLYLYRRPRPLKYRQGKRARKLAVSGNWIFAADDSWPRDVLAEMAASEGLPGWHDEYAMTELVDRLWGGAWMGEIEWLHRLESPVMVQKESRCPWPRTRSRLAELPGGGQVEKIARETSWPFEWTKLFAQ